MFFPCLTPGKCPPCTHPDHVNKFRVMSCQNPAYQHVHALLQPPWSDEEPVGAFPGSGQESFPPLSGMPKKVLSSGMIQLHESEEETLSESEEESEERESEEALTCLA